MSRFGGSVKGKSIGVPVQYTYSGSNGSTLAVGMPLCFDTTQATAALRYSRVTDPTYNNRHEYAGYITKVINQTTVNVMPGDILMPDAEVLVDELVTPGTLLGVVPGSRYFGRAVAGRILGIAGETVDGSSTAALCQCIHGFRAGFHDMEARGKLVTFFDDMLGMHTIAPAVASAVADAQTYLLTGTSSAATYVDSLATVGEVAGAIAKRAAGVLRLTTNTTNPANITLNGEPFGLGVESSLFFRARCALSSVAANTDFAIGLCITDTAYWASKPTDYIAFEWNDGAITLCYVKDGATGLVTSDTLATAVADTFNEVAFLVRNRAGALSISAWVDGEAKTITSTSSELVDNESLTFFAEAVFTSAISASLDYVEINNYRA